MRKLFFLLSIISLSVAANINVQIQNLSCPANANFIQILYNLPTCIVETFFTTLVSGLVYSAKEFLQNSLSFIIGSPNLKLFCSPYSKLMNIIESLYTIALMSVGAYYIAASADPQKRATAKLWIQNIFFMIILLAFSFGIFGLMLDLNKYIAISLYNASFTNLLNINVSFTSLIFALVMSFNFISAAALTFMTLLVRYMMIPLLLLLFPVAIFLRFLPFTAEWGSFMLKFITIIVFMTSIDSIVVLGMSYLITSGDPLLSNGFVQAMALMLGFGMIGIINSIIYLLALISLVFAVIRMFEGIISMGWKIALLASFL